MKKVIGIFLIILLSFSLTSCTYFQDVIDEPKEDSQIDYIEEIDKGGAYTNKEDVALYIHTYKELPKNYISKKEAMDLGWEASQGNLWDVTDKKSIGGDRFGNREGLLPKSPERNYFEADINYKGGFRGAERIVYSDDGLIYYSDDHYKTFTLLYGDE